MILYPIYRLVKEEIERVVEARLGVYALINKEGRVVFVGRSDVDLRRDLLQFLENVGVNPLLQNAAVEFFYFEHSSFVSEAYERQCVLYHQFRPECNLGHPPKPFPYVKCPICLE